MRFENSPAIPQTALGLDGRRRYEDWLPAYRPAALVSADWMIAVGLGIAAACLVLWNHAAIDAEVYRTFNIFFQADPPRVISNLTERWSHFQNRNVAHPLFSIIGLSVVKAAGVIGLAPLKAIAALLAGLAAISAGSFYLAMRGLGMMFAPSLGFTAAYVSGAAFIHWYAFPETYAASGATIAVMIAILTCAPATSLWIWALGSMGTLSMLLTNWSMGLAASIARLKWRHFLIATLAAFGIVAALSFVQHKALHNARFFLDPVGLSKEGTYAGPRMRELGMRWDPVLSLRNGIVTPAIVPAPEIVTEPTEAGPYTIVTNQFVSATKFGVAGGVALVAWFVLLAIGVWAAITVPRLRRVGLPLLAYAVFQIGFHTVYGEIVFLYAADILPAMMALAALGWFTPARKIVMASLLIFIGTASITNETRFLDAAAKAHDIAVAKNLGRAFGR